MNYYCILGNNCPYFILAPLALIVRGQSKFKTGQTFLTVLTYSGQKIFLKTLFIVPCKSLFFMPIKKNICQQ